METYLNFKLSPLTLKKTKSSRLPVRRVKTGLPAGDERIEKINDRITSAVIALQEKGYDLDFYTLGGKELVCTQNNIVFGMDILEIKSIGHAYDQLSHSRKFIHSVETFQGLRGILLTEKSHDNSSLPA